MRAMRDRTPGALKEVPKNADRLQDKWTVPCATAKDPSPSNSSVDPHAGESDTFVRPEGCRIRSVTICRQRFGAHDFDHGIDFSFRTMSNEHVPLVGSGVD
jgi:hypothetical protein